MVTHLNTNRTADSTPGSVPGDLVDEISLDRVVLQPGLVLWPDLGDRHHSSRAASQVVDSSAAPA